MYPLWILSSIVNVIRSHNLMLSAGTYTIRFHWQAYQVLIGYILSANIQYTWSLYTFKVTRITGEGRTGATNAYWRVYASVGKLPNRCSIDVVMLSGTWSNVGSPTKAPLSGSPGGAVCAIYKGHFIGIHPTPRTPTLSSHTFPSSYHQRS